MHRNYDKPNFKGKDGRLYLIRCYECGGEYGRENYAPAVADGVCAWCGWKGESDEKKMDMR